MRFDLQDVWRRNPKAFIAGAVVILAAFSALVVKGAVGSSSHKHHTSAVAARTSTSRTHANSKPTTHSNGVTTPNPNYHPAYAKSVPTTQADQNLASALGGSGSETAAFEAVTPAAPAWTTAYPAIPTSETHDDQAYSDAFLEELLNRDYRTQTRSELAQWVSAETAGEVVPGIPARAANHTLYAELIEPSAVGDHAGPVPTSATWSRLAAEGAHQHVYGLFAHPDSQFEKAQSDGLTSRDPLFGAEDVTGAIVMTAGGKSRTHHFSVEVFLGSALYHPGYGSWGVAQWAVQ